MTPLLLLNLVVHDPTGESSVKPLPLGTLALVSSAEKVVIEVRARASAAMIEDTAALPRGAGALRKRRMLEPGYPSTRKA